MRMLLMDSSLFCNICRLCLSGDRGLLDVFHTRNHSGITLVEILQDLFQIQVMKDVIHPWMICQSCVCQLHEFRSFKDRCMRSRLVVDGMMLQQGAGGIITAPSSDIPELQSTVASIIIRPGGAPFGSTPLKGEAVDGDCALPSNSGSRLGSYQEDNSEDVSDIIVQFCWCRDCGFEFLSHQELKAHVEWCRGRPSLSSQKDFEGKMEDVDSSRDVVTPFLNPSVCCGRCRKVFKTKQHLICHINKYDFKCKPKESHSLLAVGENKVGVGIDENISTYHDVQVGQKSQNVSQRENKDGDKVNFCSVKHQRGLGENYLKPSHGKINSLVNRIAVVNASNSGNEQSLNETPLKPNNKSFVSQNQCSASPQNLTCSIPTTTSAVNCQVCGQFFGCKKSLKLHDCCADFTDENIVRVNPGEEGIAKNQFTSINQKCNPIHELNSSISADKNGGSYQLIDLQSKVSGIFTKECSVDAKVIEIYVCNYCEKSYTAKQYLRNHIVKCHLALSPQKCTVCHRLFSTAEELKGHSRLHPLGKKFFCTVCENSFSTKKVLQNHMTEIHGVKKAFVCTICFNGFTSKSDASLHLSLVHTQSEKPFKCTKCEKYYTDRAKYNVHVKVCQLKTLSFQCNICGKHLCNKFTLVQHSKIHSEERKFACPVCQKRFLLRSEINPHIRRYHLKLRPHECGICNKRFYTKNFLHQHYTSHSDDRPVLCQQCPKTYKSKTALYRHIRNCHPVS